MEILARKENRTHARIADHVSGIDLGESNQPTKNKTTYALCSLAKEGKKD